MKLTTLVLTIVALIASPIYGKGRSSSSRRSPSVGTGQVRVKAHTTKSGKYVPEHTRTRANKTETDNWSTRGNVNPETGKRGSKKPRQ